MTDEQKPGTEPAAIGDDETARTPVTPPSPPAAPAPAVPPMTPAWDPVSADPTGTPAWTPVAPTAPITPAGRTSSTDPLHENDVAWAVSAPVVASGAAFARRRGGGIRWAAALAIVILILGTTAAVASSSPPVGRFDLLGYAPADTAPIWRSGWTCRAIRTRPSASSSASSRASRTRPLWTPSSTRSSTIWSRVDRQPQTFTRDIKSWFDGELGFAGTPAGRGGAEGSGRVDGDFRVLLLVSIKDPAGAQAWFDAQLTKAGATSTTEAYQGDRSTCSRRPRASSRPTRSSTARSSRSATSPSVKAAIDTNGSGGFADEPGRRLRRFGQRRSRRLRVHGAPPAAGLERTAQRVDGRRGRRLPSAGAHRGHAQGDP